MATVPLGKFGDEKFLARLVGKLLNTSDELATASAVCSDAFKQVVIGEPVVARDVYKSCSVEGLHSGQLWIKFIYAAALRVKRSAPQAIESELKGSWQIRRDSCGLWTCFVPRSGLLCRPAGSRTLVICRHRTLARHHQTAAHRQVLVAHLAERRGEAGANAG